MIDVKQLCAGYGKQPVLDHVSVHIPKGSITAVIGPNGSGKSTLLKCMARQMKHTSGEITVSGKALDAFSPKELARQVSYLKQSRDVPTISAHSMVLHGRFPYLGFPRKLTEDDRQAARLAMEKVGVWGLRHKELTELSGGECQKVYLAMTLAQSADALLLDEPTTYLDIRHQLEVLALLGLLRQDGQTVVAVLHDLDSAVRVADAVCVMQSGAVAFFGTPNELLNTNVIETVFGVRATTLYTPENKRHLSFLL